MQGLQIPRARIIYLEEGQGFPEVGQLAVNQELLYLNVRVLLIITGFAEVEAQHPAIVNSVLAAVEKVLHNVGYHKIILGAPIPRPRANPKQLRHLFGLSRVINQLCKGSDRLEFTKSGALFYGPGGIYANLMAKHGLSQLGLDRLATQLMDKLASVGCDYLQC